MLENITYNNSTIHFGDLQAVGFNELLQSNYPNSKKIIFTDETVSELWIEHLITNYSELAKAEIIQIPPGESFKSLEVCEQVWAALSDYEIGRSDLIINFGGGVITDMGGFIATLFKRGLDFINVPTTLLAQVDASIGGKTGVDLGPFKNQIGVFADAQHVFIDETFLSTLPKDQLLSGYAEMLKHGLICNQDYWKKLKYFNPSSTDLRLEIINQSVNIKKSIVEQDHLESGLRKNLNFGHTVGHGIEGYLLKNETPTLHGFAVAWGMRAESFLSFSKGLISEDMHNEINDFLKDKFPPFQLKASSLKEILKLIYNDKKNSDGMIKCTLLKGIGEAVYDQSISDLEILDALKSL